MVRTEPAMASKELTIPVTEWIAQLLESVPMLEPIPLPIVTRDRHVLAYAKDGHVKAIAC
jgi:hypothetical protein